MKPDDILSANRVILAHFDGYSAALVFARWGRTLLAPQALPESAAPMPAPAESGAAHSAGMVFQATVERYGLNPAELERMDDFDAWMRTDTGPIRIHVLRFTTFAAPAAAIEPHGGVFKPISELRGSAMGELALLRRVFDLIMGGGRA